jgi:PKD repeat protein
VKRFSISRRSALVIVILAVAQACSGPLDRTSPTEPAVLDLSSVVAGATLVGAGDIASCSSSGDEATANLLDQIPGTVFTLGDNAYPNGSASDFANCYNPTWGRQKSRTRPVLGNHDYQTSGAAGYFSYFGAAAGDPSKGYYSYNVGTWHVVAINNYLSMAVGSAQEQWLRADLAANTSRCTIGLMHEPLFTSGSMGTSTYGIASKPLWQDFYAAGAEVIMGGHHHHYERFAPQTPDGAADAATGIREFVVGTGGEDLEGFGTPKPNSQVRNGTTRGVLKLTLGDSAYSWKFVPIAGQTFTDTGTTPCHGKPGSTPPPNQPPVASFTASCTNLACTFTDGSSDPDGTVAAWSWSFGDGTTSTTRSPSHSYAAAGTYSVKLTVTDNNGATGSTTKSVTVAAATTNQPPVASFTAACTALSCTFTDASTDPDGTVAAWSWNFGDGATSAVRSPSHTYTAAGTYSVKLTVTDNKGATGSMTKSVTVAVAPTNQPPVASFTVACTNLACSFTDASHDPDGTVTSWSWNFGDGATSTTRSPSHTYVAAGTYSVKLTATDDKGATGSVTKSVTVTAAAANQPPVANAGGPYSADDQVTFTGAASYDPDGNTPLTYAWTFGDGTSGSGVSPSHVYRVNGSYTATLVVTDAKGASSAAAHATVTIANVPPTVHAGPDVTMSPGTYTLQATFTDPGTTDAPWTYRIDWGDSMSQTGSATSPGTISASHAFLVPGTYHVRVTVTDKDGGVGSDEVLVTVTLF